MTLAYASIIGPTVAAAKCASAGSDPLWTNYSNAGGNSGFAVATGTSGHNLSAALYLTGWTAPTGSGLIPASPTPTIVASGWLVNCYQDQTSNPGGGATSARLTFSNTQGDSLTVTPPSTAANAADVFVNSQTIAAILAGASAVNALLNNASAARISVNDWNTAVFDIYGRVYIKGTSLPTDGSVSVYVRNLRPVVIYSYTPVVKSGGLVPALAALGMLG